MLGGRLTPYIERYAAGVPALERGHLLASLAEIDAEREVLIEALTECSPDLLRALGALPAPAAEVADARGGNAAQAEAIASPAPKLPAIAYKAEHMPVI